MSQVHEQFIAIVQQIAEDKEKLHAFVNGTAEEVIVTDEGPIPTLAGIYAEMASNQGGGGGLSLSEEEVALIAHSATPEWTPTDEMVAASVNYNDDGASMPGISVVTDNEDLVQYEYSDDQYPIAVAKILPTVPLDGKVVKVDSSSTSFMAVLADSTLTATEAFDEVSVSDASNKIYLQAQGGNFIVMNNGNSELMVTCDLPAYVTFNGGANALVISVYDNAGSLVGSTSALDISALPSRAWFSVMGNQVGYVLNDTQTTDFSAAGWAGIESPATEGNSTQLVAPEGAEGSGREYVIAEDATAAGIDFKAGEYWRFPKTGEAPIRFATAAEAQAAFNKATEALTSAVVAQAIAESAETAANNAQTAADSAQSTADNAQSAAGNSQQTADNAYALAESVEALATGSRRNAHTGLSVFAPVKGDGTVSTNFTITTNTDAVISNVDNYQFSLELDPNNVTHSTMATAELDQAIMPNEDFKFLTVKFKEGSSGSGQASQITINDGGSYYLFDISNYNFRYRVGSSTVNRNLQTRDGNSWGGGTNADAVYQVGFGKIAGKLHFLILSETNSLIDRVEISEADYDFVTPLTISARASHYNKVEICAPNEAVNFPIDQSNGVPAQYLVKEGTVQKMPINGIFYNFINDRIEAYFRGQVWLPSLSSYRFSKKREVAGTSTTLTQADAGGVILFDTADPCSINLPEFSTEHIDELSRFKFRNKQGGAISLVTQGTDTLTGGSVTSDSTQLNEVYIETTGIPNNWVADGSFT
ncbi:conserved hypothetical protein [gamma proteobacterium HTCC5015]|nr:conserved hypothetical protein [gamma proteobacterium HTCC5015]